MQILKPSSSATSHAQPFVGMPAYVSDHRCIQEVVLKVLACVLRGVEVLGFTHPSPAVTTMAACTEGGILEGFGC